MPTVRFTRQLERFVSAPTVAVEGETLAEALGQVFARHPELKGYILDDQGAIRRHVAVFIDGEQARDKAGLSDTVGTESEIYVFQALTGG